MPKKPPDLSLIWEQLRTDPDRLKQFIDMIPSPLTQEKYLHWDKLRYHTPPKTFSHEDWWLALKMERQKFTKSTKELVVSYECPSKSQNLTQKTNITSAP